MGFWRSHRVSGMSGDQNEDLWRNFPKTTVEFEKRFATEADCRAYCIEARWGARTARARGSGKSAAGRCSNAPTAVTRRC
jgi:hypothetical protein